MKKIEYVTVTLCVHIAFVWGSFPYIYFEYIYFFHKYIYICLNAYGIYGYNINDSTKTKYIISSNQRALFFRIARCSFSFCRKLCIKRYITHTIRIHRCALTTDGKSFFSLSTGTTGFLPLVFFFHFLRRHRTALT